MTTMLKKFSKGKIVHVLSGMTATFAFMVAAFTANSACVFVAHQPELPESVKKLRKF